MAHYPDAFDMGEADDRAEPDNEVICRHCGAEGLYWQDTYDAKGARRPKLYDDGKPHICKPSVEDFDVIGD